MKIRGKSIVGKAIFTFFFLIPLVFALSVPFFGAGGLLGAFLVYSHNLPKIPQLRSYQPRTVSTFYSDGGTVIGIFYKQKRFVVDLNDIPPHAVKAFIAAEDARFYQHHGVDWKGVARAVYQNLRAGRLREGASTITQQVTRNFLLTSEKKISRKMKEIILARRLEDLWGKKKILYVYLNEIYLGDGCYGVEAAARNYFDKPVQHLSVAEAALLAGIVPSPSRYNPFKNAKKSLLKQGLVLKNMLDAEFITSEEYEKAKKEQLRFRKEIVRPFDLVPDFAEAVRQYIINKYGEPALYHEGLKVFTTCKIDLQKKALEAMEKGLNEIRARQKHLAIVKTIDPKKIPDYLENRNTPKLRLNGLFEGVVTKVTRRKKGADLYVALSPELLGQVRLEKKSVYVAGNVMALRFKGFEDKIPFFEPDEKPMLQGALVCMENKTGYVRALVGGSTREHFKFNRATQAKRQPGSAFKPIVYAAAIERKSYSPGTIIVDDEIVIDLKDKNQEWNPRNSGGKFLGPISLRRALELSRNICTIKILMDVKFDPVIDLARKMGIKSPLGRNLSLSLGTSEVSLFELTSAYTVFPNSGIYVEPVLVKRIEDRHGNVLEDNTQIEGLNESEIPRPAHRNEFREPTDDDSGDGDWEVADEEEETEGPAPSEDGSDPPGAEQNADAPIADDAPDAALAVPSTDDLKKAKEGEDSNPLKVPLAPVDAEFQGRPRRETAALSPQTSYIMTSLLQGGVRSGTGWRVRKYLKRKDLAGKTGTTNNVEDTWFIGFNPDYSAGVWVGYDEKRSMGTREAGSKAALPIWAYFMKGLLEGKPEREFPIPPQITFHPMFTFTGNIKRGGVPTMVVEPVYTPFAGKTLVVCPLDPPDVLTSHGPATPPIDPDDPAQGQYPGYGLSRPAPGTQPLPLHPGTMAPPQPSGDRDPQRPPYASPQPPYYPQPPTPQPDDDQVPSDSEDDSEFDETEDLETEDLETDAGLPVAPPQPPQPPDASGDEFDPPRVPRLTLPAGPNSFHRRLSPAGRADDR